MNITMIPRSTPSISVQPEAFLSCVENPHNHPHMGIRDKRAQRGRAPRDASATTCQLPPGRAISTRRSYRSTVKHLLDDAREDTSTCGSRLVRQIDRHVNYDTEYVFGLPCKEALPTARRKPMRHGDAKTSPRYSRGKIVSTQSE